LLHLPSAYQGKETLNIGAHASEAAEEVDFLMVSSNFLAHTLDQGYWIFK